MEIRFSKIGRQCSVCGVPFRHQEKVRSIAAKIDDTHCDSDHAKSDKPQSSNTKAKDKEKEARKTFERMDFCALCAHRATEHQAYCAWTATYADPNVARQEEDHHSPLRRIFYACCEDADREKRAVAFLAAEMLRRQRAFKKIRETLEDGDRRTLWYLDKSGNRIIEVSDPSFTYAELDRARMTLQEAMKSAETPESGPDAPAEAAPASTEPAPFPEDTQ